MAIKELVIKIPDNYDLSKIQNGSIASKMILDAVANGIPFPFMNKPCISSEVCEHDKNKVLDEIKNEIKALSPKPTVYDVVDGNPIKETVWEILADVLQIIDKYKAEIEAQRAR